MKKLKRRRRAAGFLCMLLCFTLNVNPLAVICGAVADSGVIDRFINLKNNLIYIAENGNPYITVKADDISGTVGSSYSFSCDASSAIDKVMGSGNITLTDLNSKAGEIKTAINSVNTTTEIAGNNTVNQIKTLDENMQAQFTIVNGKLDDIIEELGDVNTKLATISEQLAAINKNIDDMQHNYRVAHLYSLNNTYDNCLWKPQSEDIPYVKDFATVTGQFANVYTGYWDTGVNTLNNPGSLATKRAQEILGYDIIVRSEGLILQKDLASVNAQTAASGLSGKNQSYVATNDSTNATNSIATYYQEMMPEDQITWIDAVTTLYRALGQEQISYQSFMSADSSITPETSPAYQGLSNPIPDANGKYAGFDFYMFLTRANVISKDISVSGATAGDVDKILSNNSQAKVNYIYWQKALNGGFIPSKYVESAREPITFAEFFKLASSMMQAYGEPVMNDDELKALLQVYGTHYPIQLGTDIADAWAYMAARGILDFSEFTEGQKSLLYDITYTGYITRDQLLTMCMRIKDTDSRTDYKKIEVVLDLSDVMKEDYYYPVYDMKISNGEFATNTEYDHKSATSYNYLIRKTAEMTLGDIGTPLVFSEKTTDTSKRIAEASASANTVKLSDGSEWYNITLPKTYTGNAYVAMHTEGNAKVSNNTVVYIEIPSSALGGGYYSKYSISGDTATVSTDSGSYLLFDKKVEYATRKCTDYVRAGEDKPTGKASASNATVLEYLSAKVDEYTTPMTVYAAQEDTKVTVGDSESAPEEMRLSYYKESVNANYGYKYLTNSSSKSGGGLNEIEVDTLGEIAYSDGTKPIYNCKCDNAAWNATLGYGVNQDRILLSRLSAMWEYGSYLYAESLNENPSIIGSENGVFKADNVLVDGSVKKGLLSYLNNESSAGYWESGHSYWTMLSRYNSKKGSDLFKNKVTKELRKPIEAFATQYLFGLYGGGASLSFDLNMEHGSQGMTGSTTGKKITAEFDTGTYGITNSTYKDYIISMYDTLFTDNQDKIISDLYSKGIYGATQVSNSSYTIKGTQEGLSAFNEMIVSSAVAQSGAVGAIDEGLSIDTSIATSTIMDRNQQILISWEDMCNSGFIVNTGSYAQPNMQSNGAYYFMTEEGQVIVNDTQHTIQIGNTLYDMMSTDGTAPTLVYIDSEQENMMYFDYRCVMGVVASQFTIDDGKTQEFQNHLGVGNTVIYDLQSNGVTSDYFNAKSVRCYNYPETPNIDGGSPVTTNQGYPVKLIRNTLYDTVELEDGQPYWDTTMNISRLKLASFMPTANYMCFIKDNEDGPVGELFVYYLRTAFENGYVDKDGKLDSDGKPFKPEAPLDADVRWSDVKDKVDEAARSWSTASGLASKLESTYGFAPGDENTPWYINMTYDAIADLCIYTGKYYFSEDYVIRRFDITDLSISNCYGWNVEDANGEKNVEMTSRDPGAIYWVDSIGYIYNLPSVDEFTLKDYLEGRYILPLAVDKSNPTNPIITNYNLNYYGTSQGFDGTDKVEGVHLPYGVVLSPNSDTPYITIGGGTSAYDGVPNVAKNGNVLETDDSTTYVLPFVVGTDASMYMRADNMSADNAPTYFIPAPVGVYTKFGGNLLETMTINDMTRYVTDAAKVYYGSSQIKLNTSDSQTTSKLFNFVSTDYNPISLDGGIEAYRVFRSADSGDVLVINPLNIQEEAGAGVGKVEIDDYFTNPLEDWLDGLGTNSLITKIDNGASFLIIFAFQALPLIGIILMTVLIGLSFIGDIKVVQILFDKTIDPIRILTFGARDIHTWHWRNVLVPCLLLYLAFALFLNGNVIRIIMWGAEWYGTIMRWFRGL